MAVTGTKTVRDMVTSALQKAGVVGIGENAKARDADVASSELNIMLKGWQNKGYNLWTMTGGSLTLTTAASYTLSPIRPVAILSARYKESPTSNEIQMFSMTREEYDILPNKTTTGTPTQFYYDRQREAALLYVWPVLAAATTQTVLFTYSRETEDISSLNDTVDLPGEWWEAAVYNLAARLLETYNLSKPIVPQRAQLLLDDALAFDREGSVTFGSDDL
jgi:hypothetical protein